VHGPCGARRHANDVSSACGRSARKRRTCVFERWPGACRRAVLRLVVIGDGELGPQLHRSAEQLGIGHRTTFSHPPRCLPTPARLDVSCLSSVHEGYRSPSWKRWQPRPIVASDCGAVRDIVEDGEQGYVIPSETSTASPTGCVYSRSIRTCGLGSVGGRARAERGSASSGRRVATRTLDRLVLRLNRARMPAQLRRRHQSL